MLNFILSFFLMVFFVSCNGGGESSSPARALASVPEAPECVIVPEGKTRNMVVFDSNMTATHYKLNGCDTYEVFRVGPYEKQHWAIGLTANRLGVWGMENPLAGFGYFRSKRYRIDHVNPFEQNAMYTATGLTDEEIRAQSYVDGEFGVTLYADTNEVKGLTYNNGTLNSFTPNFTVSKVALVNREVYAAGEGFVQKMDISQGDHMGNELDLGAGEVTALATYYSGSNDRALVASGDTFNWVQSDFDQGIVYNNRTLQISLTLTETFAGRNFTQVTTNGSVTVAFDDNTNEMVVIKNGEEVYSQVVCSDVRLNEKIEDGIAVANCWDYAYNINTTDDVRFERVEFEAQIKGIVSWLE